MKFNLPVIGKEPIELPHFPTRWQAFLFRAYEYVPAAKIAEILGIGEAQVEEEAKALGLPDFDPQDLWLNRGYITIIRRLWHILPYEQLLQLLDTDAQSLAIILREEDFFDIKLDQKPACKPVKWRALNETEQIETAKIKSIMEQYGDLGVKPFDFTYELPKITPAGEETFKTRMIYAFSGLYQTAFDVESDVFCPDSMLEAYRNAGINGVWAPGILMQLSEFPFNPKLSEGYEERLARMRRFADRLAKYGIKLYLYINEPRFMPENFFEKYPHLRGHHAREDKVCLCSSTVEVQNYLKNGIETICRAVPNLGGFFTITRSEYPTNCYSHSEPDDANGKMCTCPRCKERSVGEVIGEVIGCILEGARRVSKDIKVFAWSWAWKEHNDEIIRALPKETILMSQSELAVPFEIGGVRGEVKDYSMSIIGPGERAKAEWTLAKECGLETAAKVQINTTWECSTIPALPVYPLVEEHMARLQKEGVSHLLLSWTLGGYPSKNIMHAAKFFYSEAVIPHESEAVQKATILFAEAFKEFPFHISTVYNGPQNAGPSTLLFAEPTGYKSTMTCFAYDDLESWRSIYPEDVFESQFAKLCAKWEEGLSYLKDEPMDETKRMAEAAYCIFRSCLDQIRFIRARDTGDIAAMHRTAENELKTAEKMLELMKMDASIGFEAANHYYFSKGQILEKILNCNNIIQKTVLA